MKQVFRIAFLVYSIIFLPGCSKNDVEKPGTSEPVISNLVFSPTTVTIKLNSPTFVITGTFDFQNAKNGVAGITLIYYTGPDLVVKLAPNSQTSGQITGVFEFTMPKTPGSFPFNIYITDGEGNSSNKLSGTIEIIIDNSATRWTVVSQTWSLHRVVSGGNKYVAVGEAGAIVTSPDGEKWTTSNSGTTNTLYGVVKGPWYVAVGDNKTILTSVDGITWISRSTDESGISLHGVAASMNGYVAVGNGPNSPGPGNKTIILNSTDGINWTENTFSVTGGNLNSVRWTGNQFIAVGASYGYPLIFTSPDGISWTNRSSTAGVPGELADVAYSGTNFAAIGYGITAVSTDGINWSGTMTNWGSAGIVWSGNRFAASALNGILTSTDGINWVKTADSNYPLRSITWSGLQYVAVGFISPLIMISP